MAILETLNWLTETGMIVITATTALAAVSHGEVVKSLPLQC